MRRKICKRSLLQIYVFQVMFPVFKCFIHKTPFFGRTPHSTLWSRGLQLPLADRNQRWGRDPTADQLRIQAIEWAVCWNGNTLLKCKSFSLQELREAASGYDLVKNKYRQEAKASS